MVRAAPLGVMKLARTMQRAMDSNLMAPGMVGEERAGGHSAARRFVEARPPLRARESVEGQHDHRAIVERSGVTTPQPERDVLRRRPEVVVGAEQDELVPDTQLDQHGIDCADCRRTAPGRTGIRICIAS